MSSPGSAASSQRRTSVRGSPSMKSGIPRSSSRAATARAVSQPSYDFLTGSGNTPHALGTSRLRQSTNGGLPRLDSGSDKLRAEIKALQYELATLKSDKEVNDLRLEAELVDAQRLAEDEGSKSVILASETRVAVQKYEKLSRELRDTELAAINEKQDLEQKLRRAQDKCRGLQEDIEEGRMEISAVERQLNHKLSESESRANTLQQTCDTLQSQLADNTASKELVRTQLECRARELGQLETEILSLKSSAGDQGTLDLIKNELTEQVNHIRTLEGTTREQAAELKRFRQLSKSVEIVEEEKRALEGKVRMMDDLRRELSESKLQQQLLQNEKASWAAYLANESSFGEEMQFNTPDELARALVNERLEKIGLLDKLGSVKPELGEKDSIIKSLEMELSQVKAVAGSGRSTRSTENESRKIARIDRQRVLAVKEVEYLRAQLKTFDAEETTFQLEGYDAQKVQRIAQLEGLVDQYRKELETQVNESATHSVSISTEQTGTKRPREEEPDERLGQLSRKNRKLQDELATLKKAGKMMENELSTQKSLLKSQAVSKTRVLELRSNPTANMMAVKAATLAALKEENTALLARLQGSSVKSVPLRSLESSQRDLSDMQKIVAEKEKRMNRLKQIWSSKSIEFREAVASVLGWKVDFMPNGRVKLTSMFHYSDEDDGMGEEKSLIFDGETGTMKISGGPKSTYALELREQVKFWVDDRREIPCFLAACTLEFYEKTTRALRI
ncbi:MAG: coiled-coil domain-containing protein mad1 [Vezdaea aestivalis]|nr:MAG: coiled-coil domain-containing protein mad1 [Vezdaea aestivalis]